MSMTGRLVERRAGPDASEAVVDKNGIPTAVPRAAAERFRSELRERLTRMRTVAVQNEGKSHYIKSLDKSSAAILRAITTEDKPASAAE